MVNTIRVINMAPFDTATRARLESVSSCLQIEHRTLGDQASVDSIVDPAVQAIIGYRVPTDLSRTPSLRWIQLVSAGVDHLLLLKDPPWTVPSRKEAYSNPFVPLTAGLPVAAVPKLALPAQRLQSWRA